MPANRRGFVLAAPVARRRGLLIGSLLALATGCTTPPARSAPVGRLSRTYADSARTDWDGRAPRPIVATVWYPAAPGSQEAAWGTGIFLFGRSARDAAFVDDSRRPLVVLSHGTGGSAAQLAWLAEALAAEGFVVAAGFSLGGYTVLALAGARLPSAAGWRQRCATSPEAAECALPPALVTVLDTPSLRMASVPGRVVLGASDAQVASAPSAGSTSRLTMQTTELSRWAVIPTPDPAW